MHKRDIFGRIEGAAAADTVEEPMVPIKAGGPAFASLAKICIKIENICFSLLLLLHVKVRDNKKIFIAQTKVKKNNTAFFLSSRYQKLKK